MDRTNIGVKKTKNVWENKHTTKNQKTKASINNKYMVICFTFQYIYLYLYIYIYIYILNHQIPWDGVGWGGTAHQEFWVWSFRSRILDPEFQIWNSREKVWAQFEFWGIWAIHLTFDHPRLPSDSEYLIKSCSGNADRVRSACAQENSWCAADNHGIKVRNGLGVFLQETVHKINKAFPVKCRSSGSSGISGGLGKPLGSRDRYNIISTGPDCTRVP